VIRLYWIYTKEAVATTISYSCDSSGSKVSRQSNYKGIAKWSVIFVILCLFCGYMWYLSLGETNFAVNNTIYQSQCAIVYILSAIFLRTPVDI